MRGQPLQVIQQPVQGEYCDHCSYQNTGVRRVLPDGTGSNGVFLVGDSPWLDEVAVGRPFAGASGKWLDSILSKRGLSRGDFLITNSVWCKPPALGMQDEPEKYPDAQLAQRQCRPYLDELIAERKPKVLVALGNVALRRLTGFENVEANNGYVIQGEHGIPVVPTYHPSAILQGNWNLTIAVILSLARAMEIASGTFKYTPVKVIEDPDPSYLEFPGRGDITTPLMCDIETPKSLAGRNEEEAEDDPSYQIIRMGFSITSWNGVSFPYEGDYIRRAKELIRRAKTLIFWNKNYDLPRLKANGFTFHPDCIFIDAMWAWHWLYSDLPKALAFAAPFFYSGAPWKHLASHRPAYYNCLHGSTNLKLFSGMFGGGKIKLQDVVNQRKVLWLEGMDDLGRTIPVKITDWHKAPQDGKQWLRITPDLGKGTIWCTSDHKVWTGEAWREAGELRVGDRIQSSHKGNYSLIHGTLLGDSHVNRRGRLSFSHSEKQVDWFERKLNALDGTSPYKGRGGYGFPNWHTDAGVSRGWRDIFYTRLGKRFVPPPDSAALAVWYCDDGCWAICDKSLDKHQLGNPRLALHGFYNQGDALKWLSEQFGELNVSYYNSGTAAVIGSGTRQFFDRIKAYVPPEMQYKLPPFYRGHYCGWIETPTTQWALVKAIKVTKARGSRYCITVDHPTHRFFTTGGLVKNCMDNAIQMGCYQGIKSQLERDGRWDRFWSHCVKVDPIYVRMGSKGVKVDVEARLPFMKAMEAEALAELVKVQELLPPSLRKVQESFKELKLPKVSENVTKRMIQSLIRIEKIEVEAKHKDGSPVINREGGNLHRPVWRRHSPFNPGSRPDLLELMHELKVKPPKARGEDRESVEAKYLKRLTKYPIFRHCVNYKQRSKLISTYNWPLDEGNRAHTVYGFHPSTWRSSSRNVNLGNIPKRFELAKLFRRLLIAEKGCKLIEIDRSALEAVLVGHWAKSPDYIKLAKAGVHSMLVSHVLGRPVPDDLPFDELKRELKAIKNIATVEQYEGCKRCVHSSNYLISPYGLHDEYEEFFPTEYDAQKMQDIYFGTTAGKAVRAWHKATIEEAYSKKYLDNSFQYRHYFYGPMYKYSKGEKRWIVDHEGDAKRAVGYRPQSDGAAVQREDLLALEPIVLVNDYLRLPTYDSLVLECPENLVDKGIEVLYNQFKKPIAELGGLEIGFEIKVGSNLAEMSEVSL